jgi:pSer/pThr/pTyr-binding forkhead associated (FHA) protein
MSETMICPVCRSTVDASVNECGRCGFKLVGMTREFASPGTGSIDIAVTETVGRPHLAITKGPNAGEVFYLDPLPVVIGRDPECDLFLNNMTVSRHHAVIEQDGQSLRIRDTESLNGTWVDGRVQEEAELAEGSLVQIGTFSMRYSCL